MQVTIQNPSGQPRHDWVAFTFPVRETHIPEGTVGTFTSQFGAVYKVVAGPEAGPGFQIAHVSVAIPAWGRMMGKVVWGSSVDASHVEDSWAPPHWPFSVKVVLPEAEYTFDLPDIGIGRHRGGAVYVTSYPWERQAGCPYVPTLFLYRAKDLDVVRFQLTLRHSDPMSKKVRVDVRSITLESGVPFTLRWRKQNGRRQPTQGAIGWEVPILEEDFTGDSQAIRVAGAFLFGPPATSQPCDVRQWADYGLRLQSLAAEFDGPCLAICDEWQTAAWGPDAHDTLEMPYWADQNLCRDYERKRYMEYLATAGTVWVDTRLGLGKQPGDTGDQHGFGLAKALNAVMLREPILLDELEWAASQELSLRPGHYCEQDGQRVLSAEHLNPRWISWNELTHYHEVVCPERFGKTEGLPQVADLHGWLGRDAEHHSLLLEVAAYLLTGSCQLEDLLRDAAERLLSEVTVPSLYGRVSTNAIGAARAVGRTLQSAAWLDFAMPKTGLMERMQMRFEECIWPQWKGRSDDLDALLDHRKDQVRVIDIIRDQRLPLGVGWRPPFEAMGAYGVYMLWKQFQDPRMLALVYATGKTIMCFGHRNGRMMWGVNVPNEDEPLTPLTSDQYGEGGPWFQEGGGDWDLWGFQGLVAAREAARAVGDEELVVLAEQQLARVRQTKVDEFQAQGAMFHVEQFWRYYEWTLNH